jgi:hypothetical protein
VPGGRRICAGLLIVCAPAGKYACFALTLRISVPCDWYYMISLFQLVAVGVNCCSPSIIGGAIRTIMACNAPDGEPISLVPYERRCIVYPNSGETYNAVTKTWHCHDHSGACINRCVCRVVFSWCGSELELCREDNPLYCTSLVCAG